MVHACPWEGTWDQTVYDLLGICTRIDLGNLERKNNSIRHIPVNCTPSSQIHVEISYQIYMLKS